MNEADRAAIQAILEKELRTIQFQIGNAEIDLDNYTGQYASRFKMKEQTPEEWNAQRKQWISEVRDELTKLRTREAELKHLIAELGKIVVT